MFNSKNTIVFAVAIALLVNILSWNLPFFWDTLLTSTITKYYFSNGWNQLILPTNIDAGHPPFFYAYITLFYHLFGCSLFSAHLAMLPFSIIGILSFVGLLHYFQFDIKQQFLGILFYFSIPAVLTQHTLVSYDVALLSFYLWALFSYLKNQKIHFTFCLLFMVMLSLRGVFAIGALSLTIFFLQQQQFKNWFRWNIYAIPAALFVIFWYSFHYLKTGWFISTPSAAWATQRGWADGFQLAKNIFSIARCFFDFGIGILSVALLWYLFKRKRIDTILVVSIMPFIVFSFSFLPFTNPINHRYFLIVYVLMLLPLLHLLKKSNFILACFISILLIASNWLIYPVPISNGWDCTINYLSYQRCINAFEKENRIEKTRIGSVFPMAVSNQQMYLTSDTTKMINTHNKPIRKLEYVLYSNVGNDFSTRQIRELKKWYIVRQWKCGVTYVTLYKNLNFNNTNR